MSDRPIIFNAPMIRALLAGTKTQTRRVLKPQPVLDHGALGIEDRQGRWIFCANTERGFAEGLPQSAFRMPYAPGNRLWVREAWGLNHYKYERGPIPKKRPRELDAAHLVYFGTETDAEILHDMRRRPSIHMPRWFSRITLVVTGVKVERLQEISEADATAEGLRCLSKDGGRVYKWGVPDRDGLPGNDDDGQHWHMWCVGHRPAFARLWDSLHGAGSWAANPWVAAITFTVIKANIDALEKAA